MLLIKKIQNHEKNCLHFIHELCMLQRISAAYQNENCMNYKLKHMPL